VSIIKPKKCFTQGLNIIAEIGGLKLNKQKIFKIVRSPTELGSRNIKRDNFAYIHVAVATEIHMFKALVLKCLTVIRMTIMHKILMQIPRTQIRYVLALL